MSESIPTYLTDDNMDDVDLGDFVDDSNINDHILLKLNSDDEILEFDDDSNVELELDDDDEYWTDDDGRYDDGSDEYFG